MKRLLLAGLSLVALSSASFAADYSDTPAAYDWTGFYLGAHGGYGWAESGVSYTDLVDTDDDFSVNLESDGFVVGGQLGFNWQWESLVLGIEGDASFADLNGDDDFDNGLGEIGNVENDVDMLASIRGRAGFAFDRFMPFITAGYGYADGEVSGNVTGDMSGSFSEDQSYDGWVYGFGMEFAVTENVSLRAEYLRYDLDNDDLFFDNDSGDGTVESDLEVDVIRAAVNFKF